VPIPYRRFGWPPRVRVPRASCYQAALKGALVTRLTRPEPLGYVSDHIGLRARLFLTPSR